MLSEPFQIVTSEEGSYRIEELQDKDKPEILNVIKKAADLGNNVGQDEFNQEKVDHLLYWSDVFTVKMSDRGDLVGFVFLHPSFYCRRLISQVGFFNIIIGHKDMKHTKELHRQLVEFSVKMTIKSCRGYVGVMTSVFYRCVDYSQGLEEEMFVANACIPRSGTLLHHPDQESNLWYRPFHGEEIKGTVS